MVKLYREGKMKKSISIFISLLLCLPLLLCGAFFVFNINFTKAEEGRPFIYLNSDNFLSIINEYDATDIAPIATYVLQEDIDVSNVNDDSYDDIEGMFGSANTPFAGTFDGNGHTISNLNMAWTGDTYANSSTLYAGLFGYTDGATIKNLHISGAYNVEVLESDELVIGGLVGQANNTTIENCYITSSMSRIMRRLLVILIC